MLGKDLTPKISIIVEISILQLSLASRFLKKSPFSILWYQTTYWTDSFFHLLLSIDIWPTIHPPFPPPLTSCLHSFSKILRAMSFPRILWQTISTFEMKAIFYFRATLVVWWTSHNKSAKHIKRAEPLVIKCCLQKVFDLLLWYFFFSFCQ